MMPVVSANRRFVSGALESPPKAPSRTPQRSKSAGDKFDAGNSGPALPTAPYQVLDPATFPLLNPEGFVTIMGELMEDLAARSFEQGVRLSAAEKEMLVWQQQSTLENDEVSTEDELGDLRLLAAAPRRALTRLYCLDLLQRGDTVAFQYFIRGQQSDDKITEECFYILKRCVQEWGQAVVGAVRASILIDKNDYLMQAVGITATGDDESREDYVTRAVRDAAHFLPVYQELPEKSRKLLVDSYLGQGSHLRQMLRPDVTDATFAGLRQKIEAGELSDDVYNTWLGRCLIDLAGSHGHVDHRGSLFLIESRAQAIFVLVDELNHLRHDPQYPIAENYRKRYAQIFGQQDCYILHLTRMIEVEDFSELLLVHSWFESLPIGEKSHLMRGHAAEAVSASPITTHRSTLLRKLKAAQIAKAEQILAAKSFESVRTIAPVLDIYHRILQRADEADARGKQPGKFRCFREIARPECLVRFVEAYSNTKVAWPRLQVDSHGVYRLWDDKLDG